MTEEKNIQEPQDLIEQMRAGAIEEVEDAPSVGGKRRGRKEIKTRRSPWVLRSLILILLLTLAVEGALIIRHQRTVPDIAVQSAPPVAVLPTPTIDAPLEAPPVVGYEDPPPILDRPLLTEAPWPAGVPTLEAIEFPEPEK